MQACGQVRLVTGVYTIQETSGSRAATSVLAWRTLMLINAEQGSLTGAVRRERNHDARKAKFDVMQLELAIARYLVLVVTLDRRVQAQLAYYQLRYTWLGPQAQRIFLLLLLLAVLAKLASSRAPGLCQLLLLQSGQLCLCSRRSGPDQWAWLGV
jgi:hypothetical protein